MSHLLTLSSLLLACLVTRWAGPLTPLEECHEVAHIRAHVSNGTLIPGVTTVWIMGQNFVVIQEDSFEQTWRFGWKINATSTEWEPYAIYSYKPDLARKQLVFSIDKATAPPAIFTLVSGSMEMVLA